MIAHALTGAGSAPSVSHARLAGLRPLVRKDATEWLRGKRAWIVLVVVTAFMALTAANGFISSTIAAQLPDGAVVGEFTLEPMDNLMSAVGAQVYVLAAIFAVASLIVTERQSGTLAWVASKPVSRASIWVSKWLTSSAMLGVFAGLLPMVAVVATVVALYGAPSWPFVIGVTIGLFAVIAFYAALGLAAGTVMPGQPAIAAVGFGFFALAPILAGLAPFDASPLVPTSMLTWAAGLAGGMDVGFVTPVAWLVETGALVAFAVRQVSRMEL